MLRNTLVVFVVCVAIDAHAVVLECQYNGRAASWKKIIDTENENWQVDEFSYTKAVPYPLGNTNSTPRTLTSAETRISRLSGDLELVWYFSNGDPTIIKGICKRITPADIKF